MNDSLNINDFKLMISNSENIESLFNNLKNAIIELLKIKGISIYIVDDYYDFIPKYHFPKNKTKIFNKNIELIIENGFFGCVIDQGKTIPFNFESFNAEQNDIKSCILSPLKFNKKILGIVSIYSNISTLKISLKNLEIISSYIKITSKTYFILNKINENSILNAKLENLKTYNNNIISHISDCLIILDENFIIQEINRSGLSLFNYSLIEIKSKSIEVLFSKKSIPLLEKLKEKIINDSEVKNIEINAITKYKEAIVTNFSAHLFKNNTDDIKIMIILKDMSKIRGLINGIENARIQIEHQNSVLEEKINIRTKELQEKINEIEYLSNFMFNILENMNSGVIGLDSHMKVNTFNKAASNITGIEEYDIIGKKIDKFNNLSNLSFLAKESLLTKNNINGVELTIYNSNNKGISISATSNILYTPLREINGVMIVFADLTIITEMHQKVIESERLAAVGKMAAGVAHEIRNPMNVIRGLAEIVTKKVLPLEKINNYMAIIIKQIDRLEFLLKEIVDFIKPRPPNLIKQNLYKVVKEVLETFKEGFLYYSKKSIELKFEKPDNLDEIYFDSDQIQQILFNLLKNAVDAIESKGLITVTIKDSKDTQALIIKDTGTGIEKSIINKIFEAFYTTKTTKGTGLGLSIVKSIMDKHNGKINITSKQGEGTMIFLIFNKKLNTSPT